MYGGEPSFEIRQSPPCSNSRAKIFNTLVKEICSSENDWAIFQTTWKNLRKLLPTAPGSKVWRQLVGVAASAEGLAPTRTSSGGNAVIIGLPSPTFPDDQIVVLTFCNGYDLFVPPIGGGCSFQVERVVLKLHKGPGAPVPGCRVENCQKHLNMTATMTRTITKYVCLSKSYGLSM